MTARSGPYTLDFIPSLFAIPVRDAELCRCGHFFDVDFG